MATVINFPRPMQSTAIKAEDAYLVRKQEQDYAMAMLEAVRPEGMDAVIVAELHENQTDSQTDYFAHKTTRLVVLGFRKNARNSFAAMRKAAATFEPTAHLKDAPKDAEHRENWSMGGGLYLKDGYRHSDGWAVRIESLEYFHGKVELGPAL